MDKKNPNLIVRPVDHPAPGNRDAKAPAESQRNPAEDEVVNLVRSMIEPAMIKPDYSLVRNTIARKTQAMAAEAEMEMRQSGHRVAALISPILERDKGEEDDVWT